MDQRAAPGAAAPGGRGDASVDDMMNQMYKMDPNSKQGEERAANAPSMMRSGSEAAFQDFLRQHMENGSIPDLSKLGPVESMNRLGSMGDLARLGGGSIADLSKLGSLSGGSGGSFADLSKLFGIASASDLTKIGAANGVAPGMAPGAAMGAHAAANNGARAPVPVPGIGGGANGWPMGNGAAAAAAAAAASAAAAAGPNVAGVAGMPPPQGMFNNVSGSIANDESRMVEMLNRQRMGGDVGPAGVAMMGAGAAAAGYYAAQGMGAVPGAMNGGGALVGGQQPQPHPAGGITPLPDRAAGEEEAPDDGGDADGKDERRMRRMLSNRESARRSRRRKQAHLTELEQQLNTLRQQNEGLVVKLHEIGQQFQLAAKENTDLKADLERLRAQLRESGNGVDDGSGGANGYTNGSAGDASDGAEAEGGDTLGEMSPPPKPKMAATSKVPRSESLQRIASAERLHKKATH